MPGQFGGWWAVFGSAIVAAFGGLVGIVAKVRSQDQRIEAMEERQDRTESDLKGWLVRVERKIDRLSDHFAEKGIHGKGD